VKRVKKYFVVSVLSFIVYTFAFWFQGCEQDFLLPENVVRFPVAIETELNASGCNATSCHNNEDQAGGLNLEDWTKTMNGTKNGAIIVPYSSFWSHFTAIINSDTNVAPVKSLLNPELDQFHKLSPEKVEFFMNYIDDGAKDVNGNVAHTSISKKLFITNEGSDLLAVIDPDRFLLTRLVKLDDAQQLKAPHYVIADKAKDFVYVSMISGGQILKIDANYPYTILGAANVGDNPAHIAISPDGTTGFVTNYNVAGVERDIRKFNTATMQVTDTLSDIRMTATHGIVISSDGQYIYTTASHGEWVFKISTAELEIEYAVPMSPQVPPNGNGTGLIRPFDKKLSPDGNYLFVCCIGPANTTDNGVVKVYKSSDLQFVRDIEVGRSPLLLSFTPDGQQLWVCNRNSNSVSVIDVATQTVIRTIPNVGLQPHGIVFSPDGQYAFISNESLEGFNGHHPLVSSTSIGVNSIIRTSDYTVLQQVIETGSVPAGIILLD
jgi:YVTN family beta-propeller protein